MGSTCQEGAPRVDRWAWEGREVTPFAQKSFNFKTSLHGLDSLLFVHLKWKRSGGVLPVGKASPAMDGDSKSVALSGPTGLHGLCTVMLRTAPGFFY